MYIRFYKDIKEENKIYTWLVKILPVNKYSMRFFLATDNYITTFYPGSKDSMADIVYKIAQELAKTDWIKIFLPTLFSIREEKKNINSIFIYSVFISKMLKEYTLIWYV